MKQIQVLKKVLPTEIQIAVDALRANKHRQITGKWFDGYGGMCAVGALQFGFGIADERGTHKLPSGHPALKGYVYTKDKVNEALYRKYEHGIMGLNDTDRWSFDQIADAIEEVFQ